MRQIDAVVLAQPLDQRAALEPHLGGRHFLRVQPLFGLAGLAANLLRLGGQFGPLPLEQLRAAVDALDRFAAERLLAKIEGRNFRLRPQDVPARRLGALEALGQLLTAVGSVRRVPADSPRFAASGHAGCRAALRSWLIRPWSRWFRG